MSVSKEGKAAERLQITQLILSQTGATTVKFSHYNFLVKLINYLVTVAIRNLCRLRGVYRLKLSSC